MSLIKVMISGGGGLIRFEASAPISESRVANYESFNIVHLPTSLWAYRNTNGRHFSISGKLVSRNSAEATTNAGYLTTVRSWVLPDFGNSGAPPPIVKLSGYSNKYISEVPCVVLSYNWTFPEDVDYIWEAPEPMPVIGILSIELEEVYSAQQITNREWAIGDSYSANSNKGLGSTFAKLGSDWKGIAAGLSSGTFKTIGNVLQTLPSSIATNPIANIVANSPEITSIKDFNNRFISGSSPQQILNNSINSSITNVISAATHTVDNYARSIKLAIPSFPKF